MTLLLTASVLMLSGTMAAADVVGDGDCGGPLAVLDEGSGSGTDARLFVGRTSPAAFWSTRVEVDEVWAGGDVAPVVWVQGRASGIMGLLGLPDPLPADQRLIIATDRDFSVWVCGYISADTEDVRARRPEDVRAPVEGAPSGWRPWRSRPVVYGAAAAMVVIVVALVIRRRRYEARFPRVT